MGRLLENIMAHFVFVNIALPWQQRPVAMATLIFGRKTSNFQFDGLQYFRKVQICGLWYGNLEGWYLLLIEKNHWDLVNFSGNETTNVEKYFCKNHKIVKFWEANKMYIYNERVALKLQIKTSHLQF